MFRTAEPLVMMDTAAADQPVELLLAIVKIHIMRSRLLRLVRPTTTVTTSHLNNKVNC
jgi:hypothetical protein